MGSIFLPFEAFTAVGPQNAIGADQFSYIRKSSIAASGTIRLFTASLPCVESASADAGSLFYVMFEIQKPVSFQLQGQIQARAACTMGVIESKASIRIGMDEGYIVDHYIVVHESEKTIPFLIKGVLKPGVYYASAWASGFFDLPGKAFCNETEAKSGYNFNLSINP